MSTRIAIYGRVSTKDKGQEVENQLRQLRDFCAKQSDWVIVHEYVDRISGKSADRDQFKAMFAAAGRREFDILIFWALDRLSREGVLETLQHLQKLTAYGVGYKSFTEQYLDSCGMFKDAIVGILAAIAKQERVRLSERTLAGMQRARAEGKVIGRPKVICNREQVLAMRDEGKSLGVIAGHLGLTKSTVYNIVREVRA